MNLFERIVCGVDGSVPSLVGTRLAAVLAAAEDSVVRVSVQETGPSGHAADRLLRDLESHGATLAVVGATGHSRAVGIALGSVATMIVHEAPCSVLVAREVTDVEQWPRRIVAGSDRSRPAEAAVRVARELAERFAGELEVLSVEDADPVTVLAERSEDVDIVVVGSRGLRGVRALGSVSERVAHEARCPVLVVRGGS